MTGSGDKNTESALRYMFSARREYIEAAFNCIERKYGDFKGFLTEGLGISEEDIARMRNMYLE
jgi:protein-tyrosine phosphatase